MISQEILRLVIAGAIAAVTCISFLAVIFSIRCARYRRIAKKYAGHHLSHLYCLQYEGRIKMTVCSEAEEEYNEDFELKQS
jgi:hypothetical protein